MRVDTHVHFWQYEKKKDDWITDNMKVLKQDYVPENLTPILRRNEIDGCIAVQASQTELETHFLVELAGTHENIKGVVGWINLQDKNIEERLRYFSQYPIIKGWRHVVQAEPEGFFVREEFLRGIRALAPYNYAYDILIYHHQLKAVREFVSRFPGQKFVLDHCAKPDILNRKIDDWKTLMHEISKNENVYCKLSGLLTEANWKHWKPADIYPYFDVVFDAFGVDRLMFGSDWPVILLAGSYVQWKSLIEKYMENLKVEEKDKVFEDNAKRFYNLN